eukprot:SM000313S11966  [mRNA]  locus=s313:23433:25016:+ [translate_table: standard]
MGAATSRAAAAAAAVLPVLQRRRPFAGNGCAAAAALVELASGASLERPGRRMWDGGAMMWGLARPSSAATLVAPSHHQALFVHRGCVAGDGDHIRHTGQPSDARLASGWCQPTSARPQERAEDATHSSDSSEEGNYHHVADAELHHLQERLEEYGEDLEVEGFDLEVSQGVLTMRLGELGTYVLNKQTPNRQLWLSSPVSGPARFDWHPEKGQWIYRRTQAELRSLLQHELSSLLSSEIVLCS